MAERKTTKEIVEAWDEYKNKHIDFNEDWTEEHDNYLNNVWLSEESVERDYVKKSELTELIDELNVPGLRLDPDGWINVKNLKKRPGL